MKMVKDKQILVGADFAGYPLKEAVCAHLRKKGWEITDVGVTDPNDGGYGADVPPHRPDAWAAMIAEGEFERALIFCGTGMGIHIAASKCPHVHAGVCRNRSGRAARHHRQQRATCWPWARSTWLPPDGRATSRTPILNARTWATGL